MATLKISELSVGDWVRTKDGNATVDIISPLEVVVMNDYGNLCACKIEEIDPIPITAEILVKNGFERPNKEVYMDTWSWTNGEDTIIEVSMYKENFYIRVARIEDGITRDRDCNFGLNYIHSLQHALRLAGVDKEINL